MVIDYLEKNNNTGLEIVSQQKSNYLKHTSSEVDLSLNEVSSKEDNLNTNTFGARKELANTDACELGKSWLAPTILTEAEQGWR